MQQFQSTRHTTNEIKSLDDNDSGNNNDDDAS